MSAATAQSLEKLFSLENKGIVLTGAAGGIGSALAGGFASAGASMALCDLNLPGLTLLADQIRGDGGHARPYPLDLTDRGSIKECVEKIIAEYGRIDVLVNCAGVNVWEGFLDVEESTYDRIMSINLKGLCFISQKTAKHRIKAKKGSLLNIASHNSVGMLGGAAYTARRKAPWPP